jgi:GTPase SAR1 family protein
MSLPKNSIDSDEEILEIMGSSITAKNIENLLDVINAHNKDKAEEDSVDSVIENYFDEANYAHTTTHYEDFESAIMRLCAYQVIKRDYTIEECWYIKEGNFSRTAKKLPPLFGNCVVRDSFKLTETKVPIPRRVTFFCRRKKDDSKWVFHFNTWDDEMCEFELFTEGHHKEVKEVIESIDKYFETEGPLKGGCFTPQWKWVNIEESDWSKIILPSEIKESLDLNVVNFVKNLDLYEEHGLPTSRGVLLVGPPGTGKTLTMEVILNEFPDITRIYAPAETLSQPGAINECYQLARRLSPTIVIIEDIDTLGQAEGHQDRNIYVSQLLSSLNSVESNKGVITLGSSNYPQALDIALRDRPGRFDSRIEFPMPNTKGREKILLKYAEPFKIKGIKWDKWAKKTDNFSGAWLRELVTTAFSLAVQNRKANNEIVLTDVQMNHAYTLVTESRNKANTLYSQEEELETSYY